MVLGAVCLDADLVAVGAVHRGDNQLTGVVTRLVHGVYRRFVVQGGFVVAIARALVGALLGRGVNQRRGRPVAHRIGLRGQRRRGHELRCHAQGQQDTQEPLLHCFLFLRGGALQHSQPG